MSARDLVVENVRGAALDGEGINLSPAEVAALHAELVRLYGVEMELKDLRGGRS